MYALLRQTSCFNLIYPSNKQRAFQRGPLGPVPNGKSALSWYSKYSGCAAELYNRDRETKKLATRLKGEPEFTVLLGPPSSGKTALARTVTSLLQADQTPEFHPLMINLRTADTSKNGRFLDAFLLKAQAAAKGGWWNQWFSRLELSAGDFSVKFNYKKAFPLSANQVFDNLAAQLKPWNLLHGERPPVIVVDKANSFKRMEDDTIQAFFDFAIQVTKEEGKMHIILTSSDSFFEQWLEKRINNSHFSTLVVGDLPEQEAHKYFLHVVETEERLSEDMKDFLKSLDFKIPFKMTGGRMFFIRRYVSQVCESGYFHDPIQFHAVTNAYATMQRDFLGRATTYKEQEAIKVSQLLLDSPGYLPYANIVKEFGNAIVEEMIERNFLHYRPSADFSRDLISPPSEPVVTAQSEPALRAMEALLKEFAKKSLLSKPVETLLSGVCIFPN
ncbi:hypothetical protein PTTG_27761 [Puccinia triticina 1-1 BBBD Race 1]|uniref:ATPase_2 domain-containing protein n=1 Tax=Puccinia triticina (isolate 1-1 / race 1 (BBBD)) TaxID=630390 RepID=A0A180GH93_PUCT1|nr:hypothetical protein PTTG_27761 [Puccinia triticina 1-1 BBBD Race 1]